MLFRIKAVIAEGIKILFMDMNDKPCDELRGRNGLILTLFIFMAVVPKRDFFAIVVCNTRLSHSRSSNISGYVIGNSFRGIKIGFWSIDIETVLVARVHCIFQRLEPVFSKDFFKMIKKDSLPFFPEHNIGEKVECFPDGNVACGTFR